MQPNRRETRGQHGNDPRGNFKIMFSGKKQDAKTLITKAVQQQAAIILPQHPKISVGCGPARKYITLWSDNAQKFILIYGKDVQSHTT